jgi:tryptophan synthase beta chain
LQYEILGTEVHVLSGSKTTKMLQTEAIRDWINNNPVDTLLYYWFCSRTAHPYPDMVARFQSVVSEEIKNTIIRKEGKRNPDYLIACVGGGSNAAELQYHYLDNLKSKYHGS